ncbi:GNAT family N-acetyltransferase [uncultured Roseovarius sp.]|mgnify:CR=1 FL=1|uniref:GNAT family N-acetyltransferase n=1 Tax=uncultured Roseovarius sp. TaxID=293344 RepID=UPI0025F0B15E|nr:GNAT family N-acetyltransferase [uncultured Roseovarius sp.]
MNTTVDICRYSSENKNAWDSFVKNSKNATFLHYRDFMEYHADRFVDHSLLFSVNGELVGVLPACIDNDILKSHAGLTYGGILTNQKMTAERMLFVFESLVQYLRKNHFRSFLYKPVPHIYHAQPAEEDLYAMFRFGGVLTRVDASSTVNMHDRLPFSKGKKSGVKKASSARVVSEESRDFKTTWSILEENLASRHEARPTHSLAEMEYLAGKFPENIRLFNATREGEVLGAMVVFDCGQVAHAQYITSSTEGRDLGALDYLTNSLLNEYFARHRWFDFGISTTDQGRNLNAGLARQKEMFGARTTLYQHYELKV